MTNLIFAPLDSNTGQTENLWIKCVIKASGHPSFLSPTDEETKKYRRGSPIVYTNNPQQLIYSDPYYQHGGKSRLILVLDFSVVHAAYAADVIGVGCPPELSAEKISTVRDAREYISNLNLAQSWLENLNNGVGVLHEKADITLYVLDRLIVKLKEKECSSADAGQSTTLLLYNSEDAEVSQTLSMLKTVLKRLPIAVANNEVSFATAARIPEDCLEIDIASTTKECAEVLSQKCGNLETVDIATSHNVYQCVSCFGQWLQMQNDFWADLPEEMVSLTTIDELETAAAKLLFDCKWEIWDKKAELSRQECEQFWDIYKQAHIASNEERNAVFKQLCNKNVVFENGDKQSAIIYWLVNLSHELPLPSEQSDHLDYDKWQGVSDYYAECGLNDVVNQIKIEFARRESNWIQNLHNNIKQTDIEFYAKAKGLFSVDEQFDEFLAKAKTDSGKFDSVLFQKYQSLASKNAREKFYNEVNMLDEAIQLEVLQKLFRIDPLNVQNVNQWLYVAQETGLVHIVVQLFRTAKFNFATVGASVAKNWTASWERIRDNDEFSKAFKTMWDNSMNKNLPVSQSSVARDAYICWLKGIRVLPDGIDENTRASEWAEAYKEYRDYFYLREAIWLDFKKRVLEADRLLPSEFFDVEGIRFALQKIVAGCDKNETVSLINKLISKVNVLDDAVCEAFSQLKKDSPSVYDEIKKSLFEKFDEHFKKSDDMETYQRLRISFGYKCYTLDKKLMKVNIDQSIEKLSKSCHDFLNHFAKPFWQGMSLTSDEMKEKREKNRFAAAKVIWSILLIVVFVGCLIVSCASLLIVAWIMQKHGIPFDVDYIIDKTNVLFGNLGLLLPYWRITSLGNLRNWHNWSLGSILCCILEVISLIMGICACCKTKPSKEIDSNEKALKCALKEVHRYSAWTFILLIGSAAPSVIMWVAVGYWL